MDPPFGELFFICEKFWGPFGPPQGPPRGPSLGLPFWNQKLTYKRPLHQIWHTFHNLKLPSLRAYTNCNSYLFQVIFGHFDVVTVIARSECNIAQDCFLATGSLDATVMLWHWNNQLQQIVGDMNVQGEAPSARTILTGKTRPSIACFFWQEQ